MTPYETIAELAESALDGARRGCWDDVVLFGQEIAALRAQLPEQAPEAARQALLRAAATYQELVTVLLRSSTEARADVARLRRGRGVVRAYGHVPVAGSHARATA